MMKIIFNMLRQKKEDEKKNKNRMMWHVCSKGSHQMKFPVLFRSVYERTVDGLANYVELYCLMILHALHSKRLASLATFVEFHSSSSSISTFFFYIFLFVSCLVTMCCCDLLLVCSSIRNTALA